jgi:hypothetical protein
MAIVFRESTRGCSRRRRHVVSNCLRIRSRDSPVKRSISAVLTRLCLFQPFVAPEVVDAFSLCRKPTSERPQRRYSSRRVGRCSSGLPAHPARETGIIASGTDEPSRDRKHVRQHVSQLPLIARTSVLRLFEADLPSAPATVIKTEERSTQPSCAERVAPLFIFVLAIAKPLQKPSDSEYPIGAEKGKTATTS